MLLRGLEACARRQRQRLHSPTLVRAGYAPTALCMAKGEHAGVCDRWAGACVEHHVHACIPSDAVGGLCSMLSYPCTLFSTNPKP